MKLSRGSWSSISREAPGTTSRHRGDYTGERDAADTVVSIICNIEIPFFI